MSFPGFSAPAAGFDAPFDMLAACHDRVRRSLGLLERLVGHLREQGADTLARDAARDVLRYFDIAAPHHHEDEERHLVPRLQASAEPELQRAAAQLLADHAEIRASWAALRPRLIALRDGGDAADVEALAAAAQRFVDVHGPHLVLEDGLVFPRVRDAIGGDADAVARMGAEMAARRGAAQPGGG